MERMICPILSWNAFREAWMQSGTQEQLFGLLEHYKWHFHPFDDLAIAKADLSQNDRLNRHFNEVVAFFLDESRTDNCFVCEMIQKYLFENVLVLCDDGSRTYLRNRLFYSKERKCRLSPEMMQRILTYLREQSRSSTIIAYKEIRDFLEYFWTNLGKKSFKESNPLLYDALTETKCFVILIKLLDRYNLHHVIKQAFNSGMLVLSGIFDRRLEVISILMSIGIDSRYEKEKTSLTPFQGLTFGGHPEAVVTALSLLRPRERIDIFNPEWEIRTL